MFRLFLPAPSTCRYIHTCIFEYVCSAFVVSSVYTGIRSPLLHTTLRYDPSNTTLHLNFLMDPLSISASILAIIGAVKTVKTELKPYYKAWTGYHKEIHEFESELVGLETVLESISASVVKLREQDKENPGSQSQAFAAGHGVHR